MATDTLPASLNFLSDAAHLLATTAPETSAHLMSQRNSLMFNNHLHQSDVQRQHVCGCCGRIMIFGQGDRLKLEAKKTLRKKRSSQKSSAERVVTKHGCQKTITCGMCDRYTKISIPRAAPIPRRRQKKQPLASSTAVDTPLNNTHSNSQSLAPGPDAPANARSSANASSKKRAKSRKQGLQALLQQSASSKPQVGFGLSLADFMKR
ncbi:hypothetical protein F5X99DRAFT_236 [Biscogniauxia marginata]|nr:hypothetical protein F5X99DRAFT_236 [Biscogniauxia marginata]